METKEKILLTSFKLFINNGYHNTSMQQLVEATKLSKGAFYHYFKNKNELYRQVIQHYFLSFYKDVNWNKYEKMKLSLNQIEKEIMGFYLNFVPKVLSITEKGMSEYYIMYFEAYNLLPEFKEEIQAFYKSLEDIIVNAIDNKIEPQKRAIKIISKYEGVLFLLAINPNQKIDKLLVAISE